MSAPFAFAVPRELVDAIATAVTRSVVDELAARGVAPSAGAVDPLLTVEEAADYLRCAKQRVYDLLSQERKRPGFGLAHVKDGSRVLIRRSAIDAHLERGAS